MSKDNPCRIALSDVAEPLADFSAKLLGPHGRVWLVAFKRFLHGKNPWDRFPVWRSLKLGTHRTMSGLVSAIRRKKVVVSECALDVLQKSPLATRPIEIDLVSLTGRELAFQEDATRQEIFDCARRFDMFPCPAEVGPQLCLRYTRQAFGKSCLIAMEPLVDSEDSLAIFCVEHSDEGRRLCTADGKPDQRFRPDCVWIFTT